MKVIEICGEILEIEDKMLWFAVDKDGEITSYNYEPFMFGDYWGVPKNLESEVRAVMDDRHIMMIDKDFVVDWKDTLINIEEHGYLHLPNLEKL